jgi:hypothetical protein
MMVAELLAKARALLASDAVSAIAGAGTAVFEALEVAGADDRKALAAAVDLLDSMTPKPFTFFMWADGAGVVSQNDRVEFIYRYDRKKAEVLALMGKACLRASRVEAMGSTIGSGDGTLPRPEP